MRKAVFSDIDGTLLEGFSTVDFVRFLHKKKMFGEKAFKDHEKILQEYSSGKRPYLKTLPLWSKSVVSGMKGQSKKEIFNLAKVFLKSYKKIFPSTTKLFALARKNGFVTVGINAGFEAPAFLLKKKLGLDFVFSQTGKTRAGKYTGKFEKELFSHCAKKKVIKKFAKEHNINLSESIGFGDSVQDEEIFRMVGKAVALNPSKELKAFAKKKKMTIASHKTILKLAGKLFIP